MTTSSLVLDAVAKRNVQKVKVLFLWYCSFECWCYMFVLMLSVSHCFFEILKAWHLMIETFTFNSLASVCIAQILTHNSMDKLFAPTRPCIWRSLFYSFFYISLAKTITTQCAIKLPCSWSFKKKVESFIVVSLYSLRGATSALQVPIFTLCRGPFSWSMLRWCYVNGSTMHKAFLCNHPVTKYMIGRLQLTFFSLCLKNMFSSYFYDKLFFCSGMTISKFKIDKQKTVIWYVVLATSPVVLHWLCDSPWTGCTWRTTSNMYVAWTSNNRMIMACELYCCLLPQCEALRICRSGFLIAT